MSMVFLGLERGVCCAVANLRCVWMLRLNIRRDAISQMFYIPLVLAR